MKIKIPTGKTQSWLLTVALTCMIATMAAEAAPPPINARVIPRPLTPNEIQTYGLPANLEYSGGLNTIGIGTPAYLEADVNIAVPTTSITNVTWSLIAPIGSAAALTNTPLTTSVPVFLPSDKLIYQVAGRVLLRPDVIGQYTITVTIATTNGVTNASTSITAATYLGVFTCELCHSGGQVAPDIYPYWAQTGHASIFTGGIDGVDGPGYSVSCLKCHTVGYDTNASSLGDGGFYAVAQQDGWSFPTVLAPTNFASMPANLQNLANIQCENCHGPGSAHAAAFGNTNVANWPLLDVPLTAGTCEQCHDDPPHHYYGTQWLASDHSGGFSTAATIPSGPGRDQCVQCHTDVGFVTRINNAASTNTTFAPTNTTYAAIGCQTCHEPHGITMPTNDNHLIRVMTSATFGDGTVITNGGEGNLCMDCHHSRNGDAVTNVLNYAANLPTWSGTLSFGPHDGPQGDMIEGINAITYGLSIPSSAHRLSVTNSCVGCHMQALPTSDPGYLLAGGHSFEMSYAKVSNGVTNTVDAVAVCNQCHGGITSFNFPVADYNGDGVIEGVQTEVQLMLNQLSTLLPNKSGVVDGTVKASLSVTTNWTVAQLNAAYNWEFVSSDGSLGVHNAPYATGLLKASIANLTGISVPGGLPDAWEITYFGSITNAAGAPDANPTGDGIPNWLKYTLGLNPLIAATSLPNGVVYADGNTLGGSADTVQIFTAAEVSFDTQIGTTYQIQGISSLSGGWENVGAPLQGTGLTLSYLTPTRNNLQQFYRVVHTP